MKFLLAIVVFVVGISASASSDFETSVLKLQTLLESSQLTKQIDSQLVDISIKQTNPNGGTEYFVTIAGPESEDAVGNVQRPTTCSLVVLVAPVSNRFEVATIDFDGCALVKEQVSLPNSFALSAEQFNLVLESEQLSNANSQLEITGIRLAEQLPTGGAIFNVFNVAGFLASVTVQN